MTEIARAADAISLKEVAKKQDISLPYLEQLAAHLRRAGFIRSVRGARGGYLLARAPETISAYDVVVVMEGSIAPVDCVEPDHECQSAGVCGTQDLWKRVDHVVREILSASTLRDLMDEAEATQHRQLIQLS